MTTEGTGETRVEVLIILIWTIRGGLLYYSFFAVKMDAMTSLLLCSDVIEKHAYVVMSIEKRGYIVMS